MLQKVIFIFTILTLVDIHLSLAQNITISLPDGKIKGKTEVTKTNHTFYSFSGVRYAQPPIGDLRFQHPRPVQPWNDTWDATYEKNRCYQTSGNKNEMENEDCLFLNIYTPELSTESLPVMVFIHGGGFCNGFSGKLGRFGPDFFMEFKVVLVSINYRVGVFGFASTNDMVIPGNAGLKDQTLALKWIQQNIKYFGGDPSKVTIFGQSAGSASVSYHLLSRKSAGLFRAAILESGSALSAWAYQRDQREYTFKTASYMDSHFTSNSSDDLLSFMLNSKARRIQSASKTIFNSEKPGNLQLQQGFYYAPVLEPEHDDAFLTRSMYESYQNGDFTTVPVVIGFNSEEMIGHYNSKINDVIDAFNNHETLLIPKNMHINDNNPNKPMVVQAIRDVYGISKEKTYKEQIPGAIRTLKNNRILTSDTSIYSALNKESKNYLTDQCFARSIIKQAQFQSQYSDVYFYVFSYDGEMGDSTTKVEGAESVAHTEEVNYLFSRKLRSGKKNVDLELFPESDRTTHYRLLQLWVNFATTLNPTPEPNELLQNLTWPKVNAHDKDFQYLDINSNLTVASNPRWKAYTMWNNLYAQYGMKPFDGF